MRPIISATLILNLVLLALDSSATAAAAKKPNILIILSDDVGWAEFGFQGNKDIPTPNIDSIAESGVRFPQGYVAATYCSPSRAGTMTGRYPTRFGHEFNSVAAQAGLSLKETTMAERFHKLGYATCAVGKWHLGGKPEYRPMNRGFDEYFGTLANTPFFHPTQFIDSRVSSDIQTIDDPNFYTTDQYGDRAVEWLGKQPTNRPWLLYVPFNAQHAPLQAPEKYIERFKSIADENRRTFAGMMYAMDQAVGKILGKVRDMGEEENTLIFFFSDNGGPTRQTTSSNLPLRGFKMTTWEGGTRIPFCFQWKGKVPGGKTYENPIVNLDILPTSLAAAGVEVKSEWKLDGVNLLPYLTGEKTERPHKTLYWRYGDQWAVRHGDWKLVAGNGGDKEKGELYNLAEDISESNNRASGMPEKVKELKALWDKWNAEQAPPSFPMEKPAMAKKPNQPNRPKQQNKRQRPKAQAATS
jgi:arylsulfatase A-like enzyme